MYVPGLCCLCQFPFSSLVYLRLQVSDSHASLRGQLHRHEPLALLPVWLFPGIFHSALIASWLLVIAN